MNEYDVMSMFYRKHTDAIYVIENNVDLQEIYQSIC